MAHCVGAAMLMVAGGGFAVLLSGDIYGGVFMFSARLLLPTGLAGLPVTVLVLHYLEYK